MGGTLRSLPLPRRLHSAMEGNIDQLNGIIQRSLPPPPAPRNDD
jgi:hypothetical protein